jgi:hypothetical protein
MLLHIVTSVLGLAFCAILQFKEQQLHLEFFHLLQEYLEFFNWIAKRYLRFPLCGRSEKAWEAT